MTAMSFGMTAAGQAASAPHVIEAPAYRPGEIWKDTSGHAINAHGGGVLLRGGVYYWYGEHKVGGELGNTAQVGVHVYSSRDLYHWQDMGIALSVSDDPNSDITRGSIIERPKVIYNVATRKYVMWFHLELKGQGYLAARAAVATADRPEGPFTYVGSLRPDAGHWPVGVSDADKTPSADNILARDFAGGQMARDMTLFVDSDGKAYLIAASEENHTLHVSRLSDDYLRPSGDYYRAVPFGDNEAPAVFKSGGRYYMITSGLTGWKPNAARSFVADSMAGPWTPIGNPVRGAAGDRETTFGGQSTFVLPYKSGFIFMADRWNPKDAIDGRYVWLPIEWEKSKPVVRWRDSWTLQAVKRARP